MHRTPALCLFILGCFCARALGREARGQHENPGEGNETYSDSEAIDETLEDPQKHRKKIHILEESDLLIDLANCRDFEQFRKTLKEAEREILFHLQNLTHKVLPEPFKQNVNLWRRAKVWAVKFLKQSQTIVNVCLPALSINTTKVTKLEKEERPDGQQTLVSIEYGRIQAREKYILSVNDPKIRIHQSTEQNQRRKHFPKSNRRGKIGRLVNTILTMLTTDGKIDETSFLKELVSSTAGDEVLKVTPRAEKGPSVKAQISGHVRDVPPYFLSVAVGARIIKHGKLAELASSRRFRTLSRGLSPAILRYGGTYANCLIYQEKVADDSLSLPFDGHGDRSFIKNSKYDVIVEEDDESQEPANNPSLRMEAGELKDRSPLIKRMSDIDDSRAYQQVNDESEGNHSCPFNEEFHSHYGVKPESNSSDSSYDLLAAIFSLANRKTSLLLKDEPTQLDAEDLLHDHFTNFTMTADDLITLTDFAEDVGMTLLFDVNQLYRTPDRREWDPTNARRIFQDVAARNRSLIWQLGNEPNAYHHVFGLTLSGEEDAYDFEKFQQELKVYFDEPFIVGPDVTRPRVKYSSEDDELESGTMSHPVEFLQDFLMNLKMSLAAITWHHYYIDGRIATVEDFLSADLFNDLAYSITQIVHTRDQLAPGTPIWLTETSSAFGGGAKDLSNRYIDGFLWMDKLGTAARMGISVVARQTLYSGNYAIIDDYVTPEPSYWLSYVFKNLVGERVLNVTVRGASSTTRLYAHCQKNSSSYSYQSGNIVLFGMNLDVQSVDVSVSGIHRNHFIEEYVLEPAFGDLQSKQKAYGSIQQMVFDNYSSGGAGAYTSMCPIHFHSMHR
ncbi:heparanase-like isoform X2 [Macrobrachium rosenbergii]|uniref:heparanase-like isoform X2 n=1 Tax=Macrobrachium rosenbergii TaxID=79674 RepID=UPI0034D62D9C